MYSVQQDGVAAMNMTDGRRTSTSKRTDEDGNEVFEEEEVRLPSIASVLNIQSIWFWAPRFPLQYCRTFYLRRPHSIYVTFMCKEDPVPEFGKPNIFPGGGF